MTIDLPLVLTHSAAFATGLVLKALLDFDVAHFVVKYFYWVPVRTIFRRSDPPLGGTWEEGWETDAVSHRDPKDRHSHPVIRQLGAYCYAEHYAKGIKYKIFGSIRGNFLVGHWADANDPLGYFGTFQLRIVDSNTLDGFLHN
jgi:hypothetical protein